MSSRLLTAANLMNGFAERTGVSSSLAPRRYLWTDAFAVCNFLGLTKATGEGRYLELALKLVDQVHHVLGRHRPDDSRRGWISGFSDAQAELHPTAGGLRIGKRLPERGPGEAFDRQLEWERDGQYFHYLTRWMHALDQVARATHQVQFSTWASELAVVAYTGFVTLGTPPMAWKMSIDLTRPLVASMGQHDPLDGYITVSQLRATARCLGASGAREEQIVTAFRRLLEGHDWTTHDALGIGGLLVDAFRAHQIEPSGALPDVLLSAANSGLRHLLDSGELRLPPAHRLAFRELGLVIGFRAIELLAQRMGAGSNTVLKLLLSQRSVADTIVETWVVARNQESNSWREHLDINEVMLATALAPEGYVILPEIDRTFK